MTSRSPGGQALFHPVDQHAQHVDIGRRAGADVVDAGRGIEPCELRRLCCSKRALHGFEIADAGVRALRVVGHVFEDDQLAAAGAEAAEIRIGRIHQARDLEQPRLVLLGLVGRDIEFGIAREHILDPAGAVDPGDAVALRGRLGRRAATEPPGHPSAGRAGRRTVFARHAPARIVVEAVGQRERECVARMQRVDRRDLRLREALIGLLPFGATQRLRPEFGLAADRIRNQLIIRAVAGIAGFQHRIGHQLHLRRPDPAVAHGHKARARSGMLQPNPVDNRHAGKDAVEIVGIALRHGQRLAAAFGRSHEVQFLRRLAISARHQRHGGIADLLVGEVREVLEGFVVEREHLRQLPGLGLVAGIRAIGDKAARQWRGFVEGMGRRQAQSRDQHAVEAAAAILQRAAVPRDRQVHLEFDRRRLEIGRLEIRRLGVDWLDMSEHLAERRIGWRDQSGGCRAALGHRERRGGLQTCGIDPHGTLRRSRQAAAGRSRIAGNLQGRCRRGCDRDQRHHNSPAARPCVDPKSRHRFPPFLSTSRLNVASHRSSTSAKS